MKRPTARALSAKEARSGLGRMIARTLEKRGAARDVLSAETRRIGAELGPIVIAACDAWMVAGCAEGSPEHVAYFRAQAWYAWAIQSHYLDAALAYRAALDDLRGYEVFAERARR